MNVLLVFAASFTSVFLLGFQSRNVNQGHYRAASLTSLGICAGTLVLFKILPQPEWLEITAYVVGCNLGILAGMWVHEKTLSRRPSKRMDEHASHLYPACEHCGISAGRPCLRLVCDRHYTDTH